MEILFIAAVSAGRPRFRGTGWRFRAAPDVRRISRFYGQDDLDASGRGALHVVASFRATQQGAEIELLLQRRGELFGESTGAV